MAVQRCRFCVGYNDDGTPIHKELQAPGQDALNDRILKEAIASGRIWEFLSPNPSLLAEEPKPKLITLKEYSEKWLDTYKRSKLKPTTLNGYESYLRAHIYPAFGDRPIAGITMRDIQAWMNERRDLGKATITKMLDLLRQILDYAVEEHLIKDNPAKSKLLEIPSDKVTTREALTSEQFKDVLSNIPKLHDINDRRMLALLALTGARKGEVLALRWEDIDPNTGFVNIRRNSTRVHNKAIVGTTKTKNSNRKIPLHPLLLDLLSPLKESGFIVGNGITPISDMAYKRAIERIEKEINLYDATAHVFRHTFLTLLAGTGVDIKTLQAIGGHADIQTTMNRYVHPVQENILDAGRRMTSFITGN